MPTLSEYAEAKMWDLKKDFASQVGSHCTTPAPGKARTDCITYCRQVLEYAFTQVNEPDHVKGVHDRYEKGTDLARYLAGLGWNAYYWNPDVFHPRDGQSEHPFSFRQVKLTNAYYNITVSGNIINYNPTPQPSGGCNGSRNTTPVSMDGFDKFSKVRFAYGLARGGLHTFLLSYGMVFQVHWDQIGAGLYERSSFFDFDWLSGLVVVPTDAHFTL
jgi:hypothetical protein